MITAVDTNIFLDLLIPNARFVDASKAKLEKAHDEGGLIICEIVWAELASQFAEQTAIEAFFTRYWDSTSASDRGRLIYRRASLAKLIASGEEKDGAVQRVVACSAKCNATSVVRGCAVGSTSLATFSSVPTPCTKPTGC